MTMRPAEVRKDRKMCCKTKDELIAEVQALYEKDDEVYAVLERYYDKYDLSPKMSDIAFQSGMPSEMEVFQSEVRLISAGCLRIEKNGLRLIPLMSPDEARNWCGTDETCRKECESKLDLFIIEYACRNKGDFPTIADILKHYESSALYPVIEEKAVSYICSSYELTNQIPPRVRLAESHKENLRMAVSYMKAGYQLKAV